MTEHTTANTRHEPETSRRERLAGWALIHSANAQVHAPRSINDLASVIDTAKSSGLTITPRGAGHSYTDAALNRDQIVVDLRDFRRVLSWDPVQGVMDVEPGITVGEVCEVAIASGWWPAVVPGTQCPTIGGCAALNVHGKNHWRKGSFGEHIEEFDIATSSGKVLTVSPAANPALFHAAIGGAGMLGIFTRLRLRLIPVDAGNCTVRTVSVASLRDMFKIFDSSAEHADYMFGWIDGFASDRGLGRGAVWTAQLSAGSPPRRNQGVMAALSSHLHVWNHAHLAMNNRCVRRANSTVWTLSKIGGGRTRETSLGSREFQAFMPEAEAPEVFAELLRRSQLSGPTLSPGSTSQVNDLLPVRTSACVTRRQAALRSPYNVGHRHAETRPSYSPPKLGYGPSQPYHRHARRDSTAYRGSVSELSPCMFHLRDGNGEHEVDILIELAAAASSRYR